MNFNGKYFITRECSICGEHIGNGFGHWECAKAKKEMYGDSAENKNPRKKLSKKQLKDLENYFGNVDK